MGFKASIRDKLIGIFILIKVIPLIVLAWFAWHEIFSLSFTLEHHVSEMAKVSTETTKQVADLATTSSIRALDIRSREAIEHLTTDTARRVADFLLDRDTDIRTIALLPPDKALYKAFIDAHTRNVMLHAPWVLNDAGDAWEPRDSEPDIDHAVYASNRENELDFHYRPPERQEIARPLSLYLEVTYVDLNGREKIKVTGSDQVSSELRDVSKKDQTFCRAETYFESLKTLKPGEIYVSDVIGAYVKTRMIGPYTRKRADQKGLAFEPEKSGYAGKENPVGQKFQGLVRWAMPVTKNGVITGYVTLALDHTHLMEFTDHVVPTEERYSPISDAGSGNYAFMWDHKGRNISHPRDYFIVGYDPATGEPAVPWLENIDYEAYQKSDLSIVHFLKTLPTYEAQSLLKVSSDALAKQGLVGLDCRYLDFAPQCDGWRDLTQLGGSGSFVIEWSGLKKLTTAATIPYYTGQYGESQAGFGFVTIGANVEAFHKPAVETAEIIRGTEKRFVQTIDAQKEKNREVIESSLRETATRLSFYTGIMVIVVIFIAVLIASALTGKITTMIKGISRFQRGEMGYRLNVRSSDEMGALGQTFNAMADSIQLAIIELETAKLSVEDSNVSLKAMLSNIIDSMPSVIIGVDTRAKVILWNSEAIKMTGQPFEEVEGKAVFDVFPMLEKESAMVYSAIEQGQTKQAERIEVFVHGKRQIFEVTAYPLITQQIDGAVLRIDNITTRVYMEEMMIQTEKMQSIGGLAAGMAHEINNPLAGILQSAQVIQNRIKPGMAKNIRVAQELGLDLESMNLYLKRRKIFNMIDAIQDAGRRAAGIVSNMLTFSRKSDSSFSHQPIGQVLDQTLDILEKDYDLKKFIRFKQIRIIRDYAPDLPLIPCDQSKLQQVFFNILKNGAHAMMDIAREKKPVFKISTLEKEGEVIVEIEDNGPGMDEHTKTRIFEPFFTTKAVGVGTGLGLYISYFIIVENHKGSINVESSPGKGTRFTIHLPVSV